MTGQIGRSTTTSSIAEYVARRSYSLVSDPQAASAAHSGSSKAGWPGSMSMVMVNRYRRVEVSMPSWSLEPVKIWSDDQDGGDGRR